MEKILKTIDALKMPSLTSSDANIPGTISSAVVAASDSVKTKKKERINHCRAVTDAVCTPSVQGLTDYNKILESVIEVLFQLCNDTDSDIRLVASDCLNRIARTLKDSLQPKFHMEVYKEIRKNQSSRSLRTALNIFAFISPAIRPQKCRAFLSSLLPCFAQISKRTEELLYENIATSLTEIFKHLGPFAHDSEVKILCKDFMSNLESTSAIIRRASSSILVSVCRFSKKPFRSLPKLLSKVTELLMPNLMEKSVSVIIGVLLCVRQCIPYVYDEIRTSNLRRSSPEQESVVANLLQVYEMCMILCNHDDHNVITTSLETLQQLFTNPVEPILLKLTSPSGIQNSIDDNCWTSRHNHTPLASVENLSFCDEASNLLESDLDVPKFRSMISSEASDAKDEPETDPSIPSSRRNSDVFVIDGTLSDIGSASDGLQPSDDETNVSTRTEQNLVLQTYPEIQIGSLYEQNIPIYYCGRFLAYNFLLSGQKGIIRSDGEIRISAKVLATNCIVNLVAIAPEIFQLTLSHMLVNAGNEDEHQKLNDILEYASHSDPLLRGTVYVLVGTFLKSIIRNNLGKPEQYATHVPILMDYLQKGLLDSSNVGVKCAISGVNCCIHSLLQCPSVYEQGKLLLSDVLRSAVNPYWLVKVDLIEMLSSIDWSNIADVDEIREESLALLLDFLSDEDGRVKSMSAIAIIKFIKKCSFRDGWSWQPYQVFCRECVIKEVHISRTVLTARGRPDCSRCDNPCDSGARKALGHVLNKIVEGLIQLEDKRSIAGNYTALANLSETFEPRHYKHLWKSTHGVTNINMLLSICLDTLRSSLIVYDLAVHQSILCLAGNIFLASEFYDIGTEKEKPVEEGNLFRCFNANVSNGGVQLLQHCLAVIKLYQNVLESINSTSSLRKQSTSPVISPVKKFSQKLEAEKKAQDSESEKKLKGLSFADTVCPNHLRKLHDAVVQSWRVYKSSLDPAVATKFTSLLITAVNSIRKLFSCIRPEYSAMTNLIDEILSVYSALFHLCPVPIIRSIREMLRCIFSLYDPEFGKSTSVELSQSDSQSDLEDFLTFATTYENVLAENRLKFSNKGISDKSSLGTYIRQFESVVVTALRIYTTSSDVEIQSEVLRLLIQLIKGHVNYGLVDSSQVFLGYVIKQVGFLEEGHLRQADMLAEEIFQFLTILTHEHNSSKKFIELAKILNLCDGLVSVADSSDAQLSTAVPALKFLVSDLFICRGAASHSNQEKKEYETQREIVLQMLTKLTKFPEVLSVMWQLVKGRKLYNEVKWIEDSKVLATCILPQLHDGVLPIRTMGSFNNLAALLYSFNISAIPSQDTILTALANATRENNHDAELYLRWCIVINSYWLMLAKQIREANECQLVLNGDSNNLVLTLLEKILLDFNHLLTNQGHCSDFFVAQIGTFMKISIYLLKSDAANELAHELRSQECETKMLRVANNYVELSVIDARLRVWFVEFLSSIKYPKTVVWEQLLKMSPNVCEDLLAQSIFKMLSEINEGDIPAIEEWIIVNHSKTILTHVSQPDVKLFISRLSTYRMEQILDQITIILESPVDTLLCKSILLYLERVADSFLCETAVLGIKLLKNNSVQFLSLEIYQFCCYVLSHINTRKLLFSNRDREIIREYVNEVSVCNRYPRLATLCHKVFIEDQPALSLSRGREDSNPIYRWCCEDTSDLEGVALSKMLSGLKYTKITAILNKGDFNMSLLKHCFKNLRHIYELDLISANEVADLLTSQKRSGLIEQWPLPVATIEFIVETLDTWESIVSDSNNIEEKEDYLKMLTSNHALKTSICHLWAALTEMLNLKNTALKFGGAEEKECYNNYIPTGIFRMSFQYMASKCQHHNGYIPLEDLRLFLKFAAVAVCDPSFLRFFDVRDNPPHIFACVTSLGIILRKLVADMRLHFIFSPFEADAYGDMSDECINVLNEFYHLTEFVQQAQSGRIFLESCLLHSLKDVVAGLGRCELVNGWILISHLGWRPQVLSKTQIFPPIQQIPLEILRNEADMLLKYISKLNLLGVASKIQFEENWVIFLSVINLYIDESFQLRIVSTGLRALSMMLQQSIKIKYSSTYISEKMRSAAAKINLVLKDVEPQMCSKLTIPQLTCKSTKELENQHGIDVNSCIRFLTDLYSQWLQNPQGKMPLYLLSEVIQSIVIMAEYFEDPPQYLWMYETLMEIFKSFEKEDDVLWPHLIYGLFYSAAKLNLEAEPVANLVQILENSMTSSSANIANVGVRSVLAYLQSHPDCLPIINVVIPYVLKCTQLDEMTNDSESHCVKVWTLLLFIWIHGPKEGLIVQEFEQETVRNILTVLSSLNKVYVSVRLLVLKGIRLKVEMGKLKPDVRKVISKVTLETLRTPNICIFFQTLKLYLTMFYDDFSDYIDNADLDPEVLMPMAERSDVLFQQLKSRIKCNNQIVSKVLPMIIADFLPPSEILNRVIAEFLSPAQTSPELVAPAMAQVFEKARRRPKEAALVREWILASLPNFIANANVSRAMWSLTLFFIGVSSTPEVACLLPFAQLRRRSTQIKELFLHSATDFYSTLDGKKKLTFKKLMSEGPFHSEEKKPYNFLIPMLDKMDADRDGWEIDRASLT